MPKRNVRVKRENLDSKKMAPKSDFNPKQSQDLQSDLLSSNEDSLKLNSSSDAGEKSDIVNDLS